MPADGGVPCLVQGDTAALLLGGNLILLLQPTDDTVDGVHEVLSGDEVLTRTGSDEGGLVTDIGDVGAREAGGATSQ